MLRKTIGLILAALLMAGNMCSAHDLETFNQSSRGYVGTGANVLIGGAILKDSATVAIRALGPSIASFVPGTLRDPVIELHDGTGALIVTMDSYLENNAADLLALQKAGLIPSDPREPVIVRTLAAGKYTAIVRGAGGTTGIALVEFYLL